VFVFRFMCCDLLQSSVNELLMEVHEADYAGQEHIVRKGHIQGGGLGLLTLLAVLA
jgi:hypothetical protein